MKYTFKILTITVLAGLLLGSCDADRIDVLPSTPTELDFFSTTDEFRSALYAAYSDVYDIYGPSGENQSGGEQRNLDDLWKLPGDDLTSNNGARTELELFDPGLNANYNRTRAFWATSYKMIQKANVVIEKEAAVDYSGFENAQEVPQIAGEALFIRAYTYFNLFLMYGDVPLILERIIERSKTNTPKNAAAEVLDQVIQDLGEAESLMADSWMGLDLGRATKNSARALLVKALVTRASYYGSSADYSEALAVFARLTTELLPNYASNFDAFDENNAESAFEWQASTPGGRGGNFFLHNSGPWRGVETLEFFRGHHMDPDNGGGAEAGWESQTKLMITDKLLNLAGGDPRIIFWLSPIPEGLILEKYTKPGTNEQSARHGGSRNNERVLRYADLKLIAAEAELKTGNTGAAIGHVNDIRQRAIDWGSTLVAGVDYNDSTITQTLELPTLRNNAESNPDVIMDWIMEERFIELASEGHRWHDLIRWHRAGDLDLTGWGGDDSEFSTFLDDNPFNFNVGIHLLFPIPQDEIDRNSAITENNPGY